MKKGIFHIAIDGPSGAGKSTIAKRLAKELDIMYLDTGAMYRAVGLKALRAQLNTQDEYAISEMMKNTLIDIHYQDGEQRIFLDEEDVTDSIRTPQVSIAASDVSKWTAVRIKLVELQREIAKGNSVVMDGRDIGTFVLPKAQYKYYITASPNERAKRRHLQLKDKGQEKPIKDIELEIIKRDQQDMNRDFAPLTKAEDAKCIDTTAMSIQEVLETVHTHMER